MSALIGGRSGNRGTCAQPCRLPYGFNGPAKNTYPLSLKDSCLADRISDMERMDVSCLKLEGRMKRPEYVAVITDIYARLIREGRKPTADRKKGSGAGLLPLRLYSGLLATVGHVDTDRPTDRPYVRTYVRRRRTTNERTTTT